MVSSAERTGALRCQALWKRFDGVCALAAVGIQFPPHGVTAIIGPNGAGKTTLLNVLTGFVRPDEGSVCIGDQRLDTLSPHRIANLGIARTFQELRLILQVSALENVLLAAPLQIGEGAVAGLLGLGASRERANREEAVRSLSLVGLGEKRADLAGDLSYGEQKLLALACCLATSARVLLLDEPVSGIHQELRGRILTLIRALSDAGKAVVFIEHDIVAVRTAADLVIVMDEGRVIAEGSPDQVLARRDVMEAYLA